MLSTRPNRNQKKEKRPAFGLLVSNLLKKKKKKLYQFSHIKVLLLRAAQWEQHLEADKSTFSRVGGLAAEDDNKDARARATYVNVESHMR